MVEGVVSTARKYRVAWVAFAVAYPLIIGLCIYFGVGGDVVAVDLNDASEAAAAFLAAGTAWFVGRRASVEAKKGWELLAVGCVIWGVGQTIWTYNEVVRGIETPYPSFADVLFLSFVPFAGWAILDLTGPAIHAAGRLRVALDASIVGLGLLILGRVLLLGPLLAETDVSLVEKFVTIAYPVTDIILASLVISLVSRAQVGDRRALYLLGAGLLSLAFSDTFFAYLDLQGTYTTALSYTDAGWIAGFLFVAAAPFYFQGQRFAGTRAERKYGNLVPHLVIIPIFLVYAALALAGYEFDLTTILLVLGLLMLAALGQIATNRENIALNRELQDSAANARAASESARRNAERVELAQRVAKVGTWDWDVTTDDVWGSEQTGALFDEPDMAFPVRLTRLLEPVFPEDRSNLVKALATATNGQGPFRLDLRLRSTTGQTRWLHMRGDLGRADSGKPRVTGTVHDVTERKQVGGIL